MLKRIATLALLGLLFTTPASAKTDEIKTIQVFDQELVNATASVTSDPVRVISMGTMESILFVADSTAGTADISIEFSVCVDETTCGSLDSFTDLTSASATTFSTDPEGLNRILLPVIAAPFMEIRITGVGSNPADTTVDMYIVYRGTLGN